MQKSHAREAALLGPVAAACRIVDSAGTPAGDVALPLRGKMVKLIPSRGEVPAYFCGVLRVVSCVQWASIVVPARSV